MKILFHLVILFSIKSCSNNWELNNKIYEVQKLEIEQSPFYLANEDSGRIKSQKDFRSKKLFKLIKLSRLKNSPLTDTLILVEDFEGLCKNCPSSYLEIYYQDTVFTLLKDFNSDTKSISYVSFKGKYSNVVNTDPMKPNKFDLPYFLKKIRTGSDWKANPLSYGLNYGTKRCIYPHPTFITVVYPNTEIESMYVKCLEWNVYPLEEHTPLK